MISIGEISGFYSAFYAVAFVASFVLVALICVCNPKSKRFHKHKSFILSHDLPKGHEVPLTADLNQAQCSLPSSLLEGEGEPGNKLKAISLNRALPDIPQAGTSLVNNPFSNSTSFADVNSNDDIDSLYAVGNSNAAASSHNHPYARIRSNLMVDSSTENDTDDYSESRIPPIASVPGRSDNSQYRANIHEPDDNHNYELEPQPHILRLQIRNNIEPPLFNDEEEAKKEISYNTISVREPLSKVLAERDNFEHHYNEVEDERISSFYEEINSEKPNYAEAIPSTSRQLNEDAMNVSSQVNAPLDANGPVYSLVDKKMKRANCQANTNHMPTSNNLYTKVLKSPATSAKKLNDPMPSLQRYSPPPPLPPPLNRDTHLKLNRNTIMFGAPSSSNSANQSYHLEECQQNFYHKVARADSEKDPGYETVYKVAGPCDIPSDANQNDYGYEAIALDESDPAYEIVKPENGYETIQNELYNQEEQADPNYEIIPSSREFVRNSTFNPPPDLEISRISPHESVNNGCIIDEAVIIEHL